MIDKTFLLHTEEFHYSVIKGTFHRLLTGHKESLSSTLYERIDLKTIVERAMIRTNIEVSKENLLKSSSTNSLFGLKFRSTHRVSVSGLKTEDNNKEWSFSGPFSETDTVDYTFLLYTFCYELSILLEGHKII